MTSRTSFPREVTDRADAARRRQTPGAVEWNQDGSALIESTTPQVLAVGQLPVRIDRLRDVLSQWRTILGADAELHLIERTRPDASQSAFDSVRSLIPGADPRFERDVVALVREFGWTVVAIERFDVEIDGQTQRWVDLRATDVVAQVRRESS